VGFGRQAVLDWYSVLAEGTAGVPTSIPTHPRPTREDVLDGRDVAELLHLPISTVLEYARRDLLPGHKLGRRWIFLRDEVEAAVRSQPTNRSAA
jgi:excisionase family DNA binding protein